MKIRISLLLLTFYCVGVLYGQDDPRNSHLGYFDYSSFNAKVTEVKTVSGVDTKDGKIEASNRSNKLIEVRLEGENTTGEGIFVYNRLIFSIVFEYRGFYKVVSAKAVGVKPEIAPGEKIEVIISADDASMNNKMSGDGHEELFLYFEIPKEVDRFHVQVPKLLDGVVMD